MKVLLNLYKYYRWLSLDVAVGAISVLYLLQASFEVSVNTATYIALGSAIWLVYLLDHWLDARQISVIAPRRIFYRKVRNKLLMLATIPVSMGLVSILFLPKPILMSGMGLVVICLVYLKFNEALAAMYLKELCVAIVFAAACSLPIWMKEGFSTPVLVSVSMLTLLAFVNLLVFAFYESEEDKREDFDSIALLLSPKCHEILVWVLLVLIVGLSFFLEVEWRFSAFIIFSSSMLGLVMILRNFFNVGERYRMLGDGIFLMALFFAWL